MTENEKYVKMQSLSGIEPGDRVLVSRRADSYELGWDNSWVLSMDEAIGNVYTVESINNNARGISLLGAPDYLYPFFVLHIVEKASSMKEKLFDPSYRPEPFTHVLVRDADDEPWLPTIFSAL